MQLGVDLEAGVVGGFHVQVTAQLAGFHHEVDHALLPGEQAEITPDPTFLAKINTDYKPAIAALQLKYLSE